MKKCMIILLVLALLPIYPVAWAQTLEISPSACAYINEKIPDENSNPEWAQVNRPREIWLKLDISNFPDDGKIISSVKFFIYIRKNWNTSSNGFPVYIYDNGNTEWDPATVTHNNSGRIAPLPDDPRIIAVAQVPSGSPVDKYLEFDLTDYIQKKIEQGTRVISLGVFSVVTSSGGEFSTTKNAKPPYFKVETAKPQIVAEKLVFTTGGSPITTLQGGTITISGRITNQLAAPTNVALAAAVMRGKMCERVLITTPEAVASKGYTPVSITIDATNDADEIRIFTILVAENGMKAGGPVMQKFTKQGLAAWSAETE